MVVIWGLIMIAFSGHYRPFENVSKSIDLQTTGVEQFLTLPRKGNRVAKITKKDCEFQPKYGSENEPLEIPFLERLESVKLGRSSAYKIKQAQRKHLMYPVKSGAISCGRQIIPLKHGGSEAPYAQIGVQTFNDNDKQVIAGKIHNLQRCKSVWSCPICRLWLEPSKATTLDHYVTKWIEAGGVCDMVTFTFPHKKTENLSDLMGSSKDRTGIAGAWANFTAGKGWQLMSKHFELIGYVRSTEVTYGVNGWHPHLHVLFFFKSTTKKDEEHWKELKLACFTRWNNSLEKAGLMKGSWSHAVDVAINATSGNYLIKWGIGKELSNTAQKTAKAGSLSISEMEMLLVFEWYRGYTQPEILPKLRTFYAEMSGRPSLRYSQGKEFKNFLSENEPPEIEKIFEVFALCEASIIQELIDSGKITMLLNAIEANGKKGLIKFWESVNWLKFHDLLDPSVIKKPS